MLRLFKQQALPYLQRLPENDWEWLALALLGTVAVTSDARSIGTGRGVEQVPMLLAWIAFVAANALVVFLMVGLDQRRGGLGRLGVMGISMAALSAFMTPGWKRRLRSPNPLLSQVADVHGGVASSASRASARYRGTRLMPSSRVPAGDHRYPRRSHGRVRP